MGLQPIIGFIVYTLKRLFIKISVEIKQTMLKWLVLRPKGGSKILETFFRGKQMEKFISKKDTIDFTRQK
jgi:hypothetical protein